MNELEDDDLPDTSELDPTLDELEEIRERAEEWQAVHREMAHEGKQVIFTYQRNVYEDDTSQDIVVVCECGIGELVGFAEADEDEPDKLCWWPMREEPN